MSDVDARARTKVYLETYDSSPYIDASAIVTKDDGSTAANYIYQFEKPPYSLKRIFYEPKNVDGIYTIGTPSSEALTDWKHEAYAYVETVPIEICCVTKQGITGDKLRWKMESLLRQIVETYPVSGYPTPASVRSLTRMTPQERDMGLWKQHTVRYDLRYKRALDTYTSDASITYGAGFNYDGDRLAAGPEGTWTLNAGGSTATQSVTSSLGHLEVNVTNHVDDVYTVNGTNLSLPKTTYTKVAWRYKVSGSITARIILEFNDESTQTVLDDGDSATFEVGSATVASATGVSVDHVYIYGDDAEGTVTLDWLLIYKGNFTLPDLVNVVFEPTSRNVELDIPNRVPGIIQQLGAEAASFELVCDVDIETTSYSWKRSGDVDNADVFLDILHNQSVNSPWQWLVLGNKKMRVVLDSVRFDHADGLLHISGHEFSDSNKANEYYYQRFGQA